MSAQTHPAQTVAVSTATASTATASTASETPKGAWGIVVLRFLYMLSSASPACRS
jgi:hypothetical protein